MAWLAAGLALFALPCALLDLRIAGGLIAVATALGAGAIVRGRSPRVGWVALALAVAAAGLAGSELWDLRRPASTVGVDPAPYQRAGVDRDVLLPLTVTRAEVTKLVLLEFEADADSVYYGLEPQFIERPGESGYRVIAYRHDGYVDFYDDLALTPEPDLTSPVTGKGLLHYRSVDLGHPVIERDADGRLRVELAWTDVEGRRIQVTIREHEPAQSVPLNLLAPVGMSSADPEYFPLFLMRDFEFLRWRDTQLDVTVDGQPLAMKPFPVPLPIQGDLRSFSKYTLDAEIQAVFPTDVDTLPRLRTTGDSIEHDGSTYLFDGDHLERIRSHGVEIVFEPSLDLTNPTQGRVTMTGYPDLGVVSGPYRTDVDGPITRLAIDLDDVAVPRQRGLLYKLVVNEKSVFGTWPTWYRYEATIDRDAGTIEAAWFNDNPEHGGEG